MKLKQIFSSAGGVVALSKGLGYRSHTSLLKWKKVPDKHLLKIEQITGIPREELRPDLYRKTTTPTQRSAP